MGQALLEQEKKAKFMQEETNLCKEMSTLLPSHTWNVGPGRSLWTHRVIYLRTVRDRHLAGSELKADRCALGVEENVPLPQLSGVALQACRGPTIRYLPHTPPTLARGWRLLGGREQGASMCQPQLWSLASCSALLSRLCGGFSPPGSKPPCCGCLCPKRKDYVMVVPKTTTLSAPGEEKLQLH